MYQLMGDHHEPAVPLAQIRNRLLAEFDESVSAAAIDAACLGTGVLGSLGHMGR